MIQAGPRRLSSALRQFGAEASGMGLLLTDQVGFLGNEEALGLGDEVAADLVTPPAGSGR